MAITLGALMGGLAPSARRTGAESTIIAAIAVAGTVHMALSSQPLESLRVMAGFAAAMMAFVYCARTSGAGSKRSVHAGVIVAGTLLALHGLWQTAGGFEAMAQRGGEALPEAMRARLDSGRAVAGLGLPGALAGFLILSLPLTWGWLRRSQAKSPRRPWTVLAVMALVVQAGGLAATRSAAALAALALAAALVTWRRAPSGKRRLAFWPLAAGVAVSMAMLAWRLASDSQAMEGPGPFVLRAGNWKAALAIIADHPLFGVGMGCFGIVFPAYRDWLMNESRHAHNVWLEMAAEAGLPAALAAGVLAAWLLWRLLGRGSESRACPFAATACTAFLAHNTVDFTLYLPTVSLAFFCLAGAECGRREPPARSSFVALRPLAAMALAVVALLVVRGDVRRAAAMDLARSGQTQEAVLAARDAVRACPFDPASHALLSRLMMERGDLEGAERHAERAVDLDERTPGHWHHLGRVRLARSDPQGAYIALYRAAQLYPIRLEYRDDRDSVAALLSRVPEGGP